MRIAHFSDSHGLPSKPVDDACDLVVLSGDVAPNRTPGVASVEAIYQENWYRKSMLQWRAWIRKKPLLLIQGNHDFFDPASMMRSSGITALSANHSVVEFMGLKFGGLPDVPYMGDLWNHEHSEAVIEKHLEDLYEHKPDVIVGHCPPKGVLDRPYESSDYQIGSSAVLKFLREHPHEIKAYLCGHCHEQGGKIARIRSTIVSNAATTRRIVELARRATL